MKKKANFDFQIEFIPFFGMGFGYQTSHRSIDIILLIPFVDIQLKYNHK